MVSNTTQLKLLASDGKKYLTDMFDYSGIIELGKTFPGTKANRFIKRIEQMPENTFEQIADKY